MALVEKTPATYKTYVGEIAEVCIVLSLGFGLFIYSSTTTFLDNSIAPRAQTYTSYDFIFITIYEIVILTIISRFLKYRHWTVKDFNLDFTFKMVGVAMFLIIIRKTTGLVVTQTLSALNMLNPMAIIEPSISFQSNIFSIGLMVIVNSIYEEFLLIGYFFKRFEKYHPVIIILLSFLIRASYHTYQGFANLPMVFMLAVVFGTYYIKYKKLWPLIMAHGIGNAFYFVNSHYHWIDL